MVTVTDEFPMSSGAPDGILDRAEDRRGIIGNGLAVLLKSWEKDRDAMLDGRCVERAGS